MLNDTEVHSISLRILEIVFFAPTGCLIWKWHTISYHLPFLIFGYHFQPVLTIFNHFLTFKVFHFKLFLTICYHFMPFVNISYHFIPFAPSAYHFKPFLSIPYPFTISYNLLQFDTLYFSLILVAFLLGGK